MQMLQFLDGRLFSALIVTDSNTELVYRGPKAVDCGDRVV